ncbi:MAG: septum formation initiator family protein [Candidatus Marinimicrobia bacterium]|nr:septum formation initiator family protein [Candidatus Neomarinimicrobiota bacterium]
MKEFEQRQLFRKIFFSRPIFILFLCLVGFLSISVFDIYKKSRKAILKIELVEKELHDLESRKDTLEANINRLGTDIGIEAELRKKFQIKKPGEKFVVFVDEEKEEEIKVEETTKPTFFKKILDLIKF